MHVRRLTPALAILFAAALGALTIVARAAEAPTPAQALALTPIQPSVEYSTPTKDEAAQCTIRPEKEGKVTSWVVRNHNGEILRRFADTNGDNVVDEWCYFQNGLEVYRDIDSNFNGKADEYRWFNTAGTRWGLDKNEDGKIDSWKVISPQEVAEQVVLALKDRDPARFQLLLLTPSELNDLGLGKARQDSISQSIKDAPAAFSKFTDQQKLVGSDTKYIDFGSARPGTIPAGTDGSTKDATICDNAVALVQTGNNHDQLFLGTLVAVGNTWKLIDAPSDAQPQNGMFAQAQSAPNATGDAPSDEMQKLMTSLEKLEKEADTLPADHYAANIDGRKEILQNLAKLSPTNGRDQWYRQLIDLFSQAIQSGNYPNGANELAALQKQLTDLKAEEDLIGHAEFQSLWAQFLVNQKAPNANMAQLQNTWLADLDTFIGKYPKCTDSGEALLQLGMYQDFSGNSDEAAKRYAQLVKDFPNSRPAQKGAGALTRLGSLGKPIKLSGKDMQGPGTIDLEKYRGKVVLIQYWATWCEPAKQDMVNLKELYSKRAGRDFDIISVCLDENVPQANQFLAQNKLPWKNIYEPGGLDGRLANEMGVMTLPLMILVDQKGNVLNRDIHVAELPTQLDAQLTKQQKSAGAAGTANALRTPATSR
jgi:thiol-disulfide isomerase/thioredoxin